MVLAAGKTEMQKILEEAIKNQLIGFKIHQEDSLRKSTYWSTPETSIESKVAEIGSTLLYKEIASIKASVKNISKKKENEPELIKRHTNTLLYPFSVHGVVLIKESENGVAKWGSGTMIAPSFVLTAAHNVFDEQKPTRERYPYIRFIPGANEDKAPFGEIEVEDIFAPEEYINYKAGEGDIDSHDYALLILKTPIGKFTGYLGVDAVAAEQKKLLEWREMYVVGYPQVELKEENKFHFEQWEEKERNFEFDEKNGMIQYQSNAYPGLDGSGVFYKKNRDVSYIVGVYIGKNGGVGKICWITKEKFERLFRWAEELANRKCDEVIQGKRDLKELVLNGKPLNPRNLSELLEQKLDGLEEIAFSFASLDDKGIKVLTNSSQWPNLQKLYLLGNAIRKDGICEIVQNKVWSNLEVLNIAHTKIGEEGALALSKATWNDLKVLNLTLTSIQDQGGAAIGSNNTWENLEYLYLGSNRLSKDSASAIANNTTWRKLKELDLSNNSIDDEGGAAISKNTTWEMLTELNLASNKLGTKSALAISNNQVWNNLKRLDLSENPIGKEGGTAIGRNTLWKNLEQLRLSSCEIGDEGALAIGSNTTWTKLQELYLSYNNIGPKGGAAIGCSMIWKNLKLLSLEGNQIGDKGATAIAGNTCWKDIVYLDLSMNEIGDEGAVAIGRNTTWENLELIRLGDNNIGDRGALSLSNNTAWGRLLELTLVHNLIGDEGGIAIGRNRLWKALQALSLDNNQIRWKTAIELARNDAWNDIETVYLSENDRLTRERRNALRTIQSSKTLSVFR